MRILIKYIFTVLIFSVLFSCSKNPNAPNYEREVAVFGFLWGNKPMTSDRAIMISYSQPIDELFNLAQSIITNAVVTITELTSGKIYSLTDDEKPGFYFNDSLIAKPKNSYLLKVEVDDKIVTATTTIPPNLIVHTRLSTDKTNSVYQGDLSFMNPIFIGCEYDEQIIVVDVYCNESWEDAEYINPFWGQDKPGNLGEYAGNDGNSEPRHIIASAKYMDLYSSSYSGLHVIDWYASMIAFYGSYTLQVIAIDENYYNFINKNEYPELQSGVEGGIGVFGSVCGETYRLNILKP